MLRSAAFVSALLAVCLANQAAMAGKRVALVIGNSSYQNVAALTNPVHDAAAVTEMFKNASFDLVESRRDLTSQEMRRALRDFGDKARGADIAVIYFAGHGLEVDGTNYVVPVDAVLERDADVDDEAVSLNRILVAAEPATKLRLIILDACRDNPFTKKMKRTVAARSLGRGLVGVEANRPNTFIAFAAKEGSTAADGDGQNSPFSTALLKHLTRPGLDIRKAFGYVRDDVMSATGNQQEPYTTNSLGGNDVALVPAPAAAPAANDNANAEIRRDYELAERVGTKEAWDSFVAAHPSGFYADLAKAQRNKLAAETARIEATEKARLAAEEQARLAAEGAKASEQAKAVAQSKAAEEAKLAAEKKTQVEDAKVAAAERAKAAEDARLAGEKARMEAEKAAASKAASGIAPTAMAVPTADKPDAAKSTGPAVAARTPGQANPDATRSNQPAQPDLPRLLQTELRRVGCKSGEIDGEWNASSRRALSSFNDHAGTKFDVKLASTDALDAVKAKTGRVCPLDCERGFRAEGDHCVKITCDAGYVLGSNGSCQKRPPQVTQRERHAPASPRHKCFVYNGASVCE
ncbi:Uncharacterized protein, contains caspase domain [Bradyrhizobium lablabi]|uniref:Uncharacterized protein, contains caspase domain n=1 Tax=Bradyrhizobium lablabi TaxID=722472 RepID=A0A1M6Y2R8_9BRAD|nr:caspase family protein [Bradyrhizobium lablabi]SHL12517.1 Uncharacterized protein, contains caspase domain [Bradyrhizobium lablabi]